MSEIMLDFILSCFLEFLWLTVLMLVQNSVLKDPMSVNISGGRADGSCGIRIDFPTDTGGGYYVMLQKVCNGTAKAQGLLLIGFIWACQ